MVYNEPCQFSNFRPRPLLARGFFYLSPQISSQAVRIACTFCSMLRLQARTRISTQNIKASRPPMSSRSWLLIFCENLIRVIFHLIRPVDFQRSALKSYPLFFSYLPINSKKVPNIGTKSNFISVTVTPSSFKLYSKGGHLLKAIL